MNYIDTVISAHYAFKNHFTYSNIITLDLD